MCCIELYHDMPYYAMPYYVMPYYAMPRHTESEQSEETTAYVLDFHMCMPFP